MNGVDEAIVMRANELVSLSVRGEDLVAACARMSKVEEAILEKAVCAMFCRQCYWKADKLTVLLGQESIARRFLNMDLSTNVGGDTNQHLADLLANGAVVASD